MPQRFQHILVLVDFTEKNETALQVALDVALQNKSRVTLPHETLDAVKRLVKRSWGKRSSERLRPRCL